MMDFFDADAEIGKASTPTEMRAEISRLSRNDRMVRSILQSAEYSGQSAEDKYTMLAYYALVERDRFRITVLRQLSIDPGTPIIIPKE